MKTILKLTALSAILLNLVVLLASCNDKDHLKDDEHSVVCVQIVPAGVGFCLVKISIESEKPIANTNSEHGFVVLQPKINN